MSETLFMETTQISPEKTISEIQTWLVKYGATSIMMEYENLQVSAVSFRILIDGNHIPFRLPCKWSAVHKILCDKNSRLKKAWNKEEIEKIKSSLTDQARRVAWRITLRWIQAQFAYVQTGMVKTQEVFMPYMQIRDGETVFEYLEKSKYSGFLLENSK